ncbi:hypothetical protein LTR97_011009 [Elasticomyces elasticus]|uniref:Uncharacterized protein n=1 Tax=Elasticomyces elasticus TaxID=574655 RepID=A0AAN7VYI9_9PEZI|nr:hypothetical protein LTR97_011009 [Elasticomyces elasticus]
MADTTRKPRRKPRNPPPSHHKLPKLPQNACVTKRPLQRPAIASPYAGASQPKIVYVSARTPFMSAVKRVDKLLHLSEKRAVQSATTVVKQQGRKRKRGQEDEVLGIAKQVEKAKAKKRRGGDAGDEDEDAAGEAVLIKGTGRAIEKALEMASWFQQKPEYLVVLKTGSVGAIDDVEVEEDNKEGVEGDLEELDDGNVGDVSMLDASIMGEAPVRPGAESDDDTAKLDGEVQNPRPEEPCPAAPDKPQAQSTSNADNTAPASVPTTTPAQRPAEPVPETRIRYVSVLEVAALYEGNGVFGLCFMIPAMV